MKLSQPAAEIFIPDHLPVTEAMARITHLGIGAHQDDLEFMAFHGILTCYQTQTHWFGGVTCTDGSGSVRAGALAELTLEQFKAVRRSEQNAAAVIGRYGVMCQLDHGSQSIKQAPAPALEEDLSQILRATRPEVVYTHNLVDKHATHIAVAAAVVRAVRAMPPADRPEKLWGCELWRGLDWLPDADKVVFDVSGGEELAAALGGVFVSQTAGGKRYDRAISGRRAANATLFDPRAPDQAEQVIFALDLTPLIRNDSLDPAAFIDDFIGRFRHDVGLQLRQQFGI